MIENFLHLIKGICEKPPSSITRNGKGLNAFILDQELGKDVHSHCFYATLSWSS